MNIELEILECLDMAGDRLTPERVIFSDVRRAVGEDVPDADIKRGIKRLQNKGHVIGSAHQDLGNRWKNTDEGKVRLAEANG